MKSQAVAAFEATIQADPIRTLMAGTLLQKLESLDASNPEYRDRAIDAEWQTFRKGWLAGNADSVMLDWLLGRLYLARPARIEDGTTKDIWNIVNFSAPAWNTHTQGPHKMREVIAAAMKS